MPLNRSFSYLIYDSDIFSLNIFLKLRMSIEERYLPDYKISGTNINNLRYADDTTLVAESEEELKRAS